MSDDISSLEIWETKSQQVLEEESEEQIFATSFHCMLLLSFYTKAVLLYSGPV